MNFHINLYLLSSNLSFIKTISPKNVCTIIFLFTAQRKVKEAATGTSFVIKFIKSVALVLFILRIVYCFFTKDATAVFLSSRSANSPAKVSICVCKPPMDWLEKVCNEVQVLQDRQRRRKLIGLSAMVAVKDKVSIRRLAQRRENLESWRESLARGSWRHGLWRYHGSMKPSDSRVFPWAGRFLRLSGYFGWLRLHTGWSQLCNPRVIWDLKTNESFY